MVFYIETAYVLLFTLLLSIALFLFIVQGGNTKSLILRSAIISYLMIFYSNFYLHLLLLVIYFALLYRDDYGRSMQGIIIYLLIISVIPKIAYSKYDNLVVYINQTAFGFLLLILIITCIAYLFLPLLKRYWILKTHQFAFKLSIGKYILLGQGFLDSGNSSAHNQIPIIFLKNQDFCQRLFFEKPMLKVQCNNLNSVKEYDATLGVITIMNNKHQVYVVFDEKLSIKEDALLNIRLLEWRN